MLGKKYWLMLLAASVSTQSLVFASEIQRGGISHSDANTAVRVISQKEASVEYTSPRHMKINSGTVLIDAGKGDVSCDTDMGTIAAGEGSVFAVSNSWNGIRVFSCSATHITFLAGGASIIVQPGEEVFVVRRRPMQSEVHPADGVARKRTQLYELTGDWTAALSQFSIPTLLRSGDYFGEWTKLSGGKYDPLTSRMLKTAAAVSYARRNGGFAMTAPSMPDLTQTTGAQASSPK